MINSHSAQLLRPQSVRFEFKRAGEPASFVTVEVDLTGVGVSQGGAGSWSFWMLHSDLQLIAAASAQLQSWKTPPEE